MDWNRQGDRRKSSSPKRASALGPEIDYESTKVLMRPGAAEAILQEEKDGQNGPDMIIAELKELQGEYAQLSELEEMEHDYAEKLVQGLKDVQVSVEGVIPLERAALGPAYRYAKEAFLGGEAVVIILNNSGISTAIPLTKFKSSEILAIVQSAIPHLKKALTQKRKETSERVELLEMILKEMKRAGSTAKHQVQQYDSPAPAAAEEDLVSSSLAGQ